MGLFLDYLRSFSLYTQLCDLIPSPEGNLLESTNDVIAEAQIEFLRWAVYLANPRVILEIGTNKGFFAYLMSHVCQNVTIYTFDIDQRSALAVDLINRQQRNVTAVFQAGDSRVTLAGLNVQVHFAWIDGGHAGDIPLSDLMHCYRLRIPYVAVEDTVFPDVAIAVDRLVQQTPYRLLANPFAVHDRRRAILLHLGEERGCKPPESIAAHSQIQAGRTLAPTTAPSLTWTKAVQPR